MKTNKKITAIVATIALVAILGVCLVACNADDYEDRLENLGYQVSQYQYESEEAGIAVWGLRAAKKGDGPAIEEHVRIVKFKKIRDAKKAESNLKMLGEIVRRKTKIVYWGTAQAVEDVRYLWSL